jgi:hypothetical protein
MNLEHLKVGDRVDRYHGSGFFMEMEVVGIMPGLLICAAVQKDKDGKELGLFKGGWLFESKTGAEYDEELKWGTRYGVTGTYLKLKEKS